MLEEHIEMLYKKCLQIVKNYPSLFPIVDILSTLYKQEKYFPLVIHLFETRTGFKYIFNDYINKAKCIRGFIPLNQLDSFDKSIIKNILYHFTQPFPTNKDHKNWKDMVKIEDLE